MDGAGSKPHWSRRAGLTFVVATALALPLLILAVVVPARWNGDGLSFRAADQGPYRGSEPPGRFPMPAFSLQGYRGNAVSTEQLRGRIVLLTFLDSHCTDACPIIASVVARTMERLTAQERRHVKAVAITTDPSNDTPATVERFLQRQRATAELEYLLDSETRLRRLWKEFYVLSSLETGDPRVHSAPLRIYNRELVWVATLHTAADLSEANLLHDIRTALSAGQR